MASSGAAESAPEPLDGDVLQAAADAAEADSSGLQLPEGIDGAAMASATAELANQLKSITEEMNRLKSELYSDEGGLGGISAQLEELQEKAIASATRGGGGSTGAGTGGRGGGAMRRPLPRARAEERQGERQHGRANERVAFAPGTKDGPSRRGLRERRPPREPPTPGWTPYIIGFCLLMLGPMRPLLWQVLKELPWPTLWLGDVRDAGEPAWYDQ